MLLCKAVSPRNAATCPRAYHRRQRATLANHGERSSLRLFAGGIASLHGGEFTQRSRGIVPPRKSLQETKAATPLSRGLGNGPTSGWPAQHTLGVAGTARILAIKAARYGRSSSLKALNLSPIPVPETACRTMASARTCPSRTRKLRLTVVPWAVCLGVSMNKPPKLIFWTCERSSSPSQRQ
jgi:hypothetical protein